MAVARRWHLTTIVAALVASLALPLVSCTSHQATMVDEGSAYSLESVAELQTLVERPAAAGAPVSEATALRREALVDLRSQGAIGAEFAEFVTRTLPDNGRSVPYYGEAAIVEGVDSWVLLEVWGSAGGTLDHVRIWVFDRSTGDVLFSSTSR